MIASTDWGTSWKMLDATFDVSLHWWALRGRLIETNDGLIMTIYRATSEEKL